MRLFFGAAVAVFFLSMEIAAAGGEIKRGHLTVKDVWSRATPARNGVAYMTILNHGGGADRLVAAEVSIAKKVELHSHSMKDGVMRMRRISSIEVHPGETAVLAPGGNHLMLIGLHQSLKEGENFSLTLVVEKGGKISVDVFVGKAGAAGYYGKRNDYHKTGDHYGHKHGS